MVLSFPAIRFTVKLCSAFSLFGKPSVEFLGNYWIGFSCICSYLYLIDSNQCHNIRVQLYIHCKLPIKAVFHRQSKKTFCHFDSKLFSLKINFALVQLSLYFFSEKFMIRQVRKKHLSQQCFDLCRNVTFPFRHKWKQSLNLLALQSVTKYYIKLCHVLQVLIKLWRALAWPLSKTVTVVIKLW